MTNELIESDKVEELAVHTDAAGAYYVLPLEAVRAGRVTEEAIPALRELIEADTGGFGSFGAGIVATHGIIVVGGMGALGQHGIVVQGGRTPLGQHFAIK